MRTQSLGILVALVSLIGASGASCQQQRVVQALPPAAFSQTPTLEDVTYVVNANSQRVQQLQSQGGSLDIDGMPSLRADLVMAQPRNLRLRAQLLGLTGPDLDLGSNDYEFWIWSKYFSPRALYFAQHAQFSRSAARSIMPVEPEWLFEALGLTQFDPGGLHAGPYRTAQGRLEIHSRIPTAGGDLNKITVVNDTYGWVLEQSVRDANGVLLASARTSKHRYYPEHGASLPHSIDISLPPAQLAFRLDVANFILNQPLGNATDLWTRPNYDGFPPVDLAGPQFGAPPGYNSGYSHGYPANGYPAPSGAPIRPPPSVPSAPYNTSYRSRVRGLH